MSTRTLFPSPHSTHVKLTTIAFFAMCSPAVPFTCASIDAGAQMNSLPKVKSKFRFLPHNMACDPSEQLILPLAKSTAECHGRALLLAIGDHRIQERTTTWGKMQ